MKALTNSVLLACITIFIIFSPAQLIAQDEVADTAYIFEIIVENPVTSV